MQLDIDHITEPSEQDLQAVSGSCLNCSTTQRLAEEAVGKMMRDRPYTHPELREGITKSMRELNKVADIASETRYNPPAFGTIGNCANAKYLLQKYRKHAPA